jgi:hypothetical protein
MDMKYKNKMKNLVLVVAGFVALSAVSAVPHSAPTEQDLAGHDWLNKVRANPTIILPELNYMLCLEQNPVPTPGGAFDIVNNVCGAVSGALWNLIGSLIGNG